MAHETDPQEHDEDKAMPIEAKIMLSGMFLGLLLGVALDNIPLGFGLGSGLGLCLGYFAKWKGLDL